MKSDDECIQCGQCCSNYLPLSEKEIMGIRRYIESHHVKEYNQEFLDCPFLNTKKPAEKCDIYPVRPHICREYTCKTLMTGEIPESMRNDVYQVIDMRLTFFGDEIL